MTASLQVYLSSSGLMNRMNPPTTTWQPIQMEGVFRSSITNTMRQLTNNLLAKHVKNPLMIPINVTVGHVLLFNVESRTPQWLLINSPPITVSFINQFLILLLSCNTNNLLVKHSGWNNKYYPNSNSSRNSSWSNLNNGINAEFFSFHFFQ